MLIKLDNPAMLGKAIDLISELVAEVRMKFNDFGLSITAIDPANVAMVGFKIPKSAFSQFESGTETLGISLDNFKKILRRAGNGSSLVIESKDNYLNIKIHDRIKRDFNLSLIDVEAEDVDFDSKTGRMEFTAKVDLNSSDIIDSVEDAAVVSDACSFILENGKFIIEAKGLNSAKSEFSGDEAKISGEPCKARYSLEYLQKFMKGAKLFERTVLNFSEDHPLKIDFVMPGMQLGLVLAPRVETED